MCLLWNTTCSPKLTTAWKAYWTSSSTRYAQVELRRTSTDKDKSSDTRVLRTLMWVTNSVKNFFRLVYGQFRHTISIAMPYRCSKCSLCFNDSHLLQVHMKTNQCLPKVPWDVQSVLILDDVRHGPFLFTDCRPKINYLYTDILQNQ